MGWDQVWKWIGRMSVLEEVTLDAQGVAKEKYFCNTLYDII